MRELDECAAEVFRRSEKRIKERGRNRNRALALCIPICLIAAVWSVMDLPARMSAMTSDSAQFAEEIDRNDEVSFACPYIAVEIQDDGISPEHYEKVTDTEAVAEMFIVIHSLFTDADGNNPNTGVNYPADESTVDNCFTDPANEMKGCTITFTTEKGSQAVYNLSENILLNVYTHETVFLSDAQAAGLMAVLGISG